MVDAKSPIQRINELSALARSAWFSLLGVLAFMAVTLLSITHGDVLLDSRMIALPLVSVEVPTRLFLYLAPVVVTVLYINLHLYVTKLWQSFQFAPDDLGAGALVTASCKQPPDAEGHVLLSDGSPVPVDSLRLADCIQPWLVNDYALALKAGTQPRDHNRILARKMLTVFTVWLAAPLVIAWLWTKALLARDLPLSMIGLACLLVTVAVGVHSRLEAEARIRHGVDLRKDAAAARRFVWYNRAAFAGLVLAGLAAVSLTTPSLAVSDHAPVYRQTLDLDNQRLASLPAGWEGATASRESFRKLWCSIRGDIPGELCATIPADTEAETRALLRKRVAFCVRESEKRPAKPGCHRRFQTLDHQFDADWASVRRDALRLLTKIDLDGRDLSRLSARDANLTAADLDGADLVSARLDRGSFEGIQLIGARLDGLSAYYADLRFADLTQASLRPAVHLETGRVAPVNLSGTRLEAAYLYGALLPGTRLVRARLTAADLGEADLSGADLREALLHRARLDGAILVGADLGGVAGLTQDQLDRAVIDAHTKLPRAPGGRAALYGYSCLQEPPRKLLANPYLTQEDRSRIAALVCSKGEVPERVTGSADAVAVAPAPPRTAVLTRLGDL